MTTVIFTKLKYESQQEQNQYNPFSPLKYFAPGKIKWKHEFVIMITLYEVRIKEQISNPPSSKLKGHSWVLPVQSKKEGVTKRKYSERNILETSLAPFLEKNRIWCRHG